MSEENIICKCRNVSQKTIEDAIKNGCDTVSKVGEATNAGTACGGCKNKIQNLIDKTLEK